MPNEIYYTATFAEVPAPQFREWQDLILRLGGTADPVAQEPIPYNARVCNAADARPRAGDVLLLNRWNRIDGFTSGGRFFVGVES
jgi:hypothetical protein